MFSAESEARLPRKNSQAIQHMGDFLEIIGLLAFLAGGIWIGKLGYAYYCKAKGKSFKAAIDENGYAFFNLVLYISIFLYFLIKTLVYQVYDST